MNSEWHSNKGASSRVAQILEQAGIPLELQVASICKEFFSTSSSSDKVDIFTEKIIYSQSDSEEEYREIDQRVTFYEEFEVSDLTGVMLDVRMPIECKYRKDVEFFAFCISENDSHQGFPIFGDFAGSEYFRSLESTYKKIENIDVCAITMVEIADGRTPQKIHKENLIYNAAAALYDYVIFTANQYIETDFTFENNLIDSLGLFEKYQKYLKKNCYDWSTTLRKWSKKAISKQKINQFNSNYFSNKRIFHYLCAYIPIICVNGPIYRVTWSKNSGIKTFERIDYCLSTIRKHGWPGKARFSLVKRTAEVPVVVTNIDGLKQALDIGRVWYEEIHRALTEGSSELKNRWALESAFYNRVVRHYSKLENNYAYQSDICTENWL